MPKTTVPPLASSIFRASARPLPPCSIWIEPPEITVCAPPCLISVLPPVMIVPAPAWRICSCCPAIAPRTMPRSTATLLAAMPPISAL